MAINFPNNPSLDDVYTEGNRSWSWNGVYWRARSTTVGYTGSLGYTGSQGSGLLVKGTVATEQDLVIDVNTEIGDAYVVTSTGDIWVYDGTQFNNAGQFIGYTGSQGYTGSEGESSFTWGDTPPANPDIGARWYDTKRGYLVVYVDDGDSQQWVEVSASGFLGQQGEKGYTGSVWAGSVQIFDSTITGDLVIPEGKNGLTVGAVSLATGATINIAAGQRWVII